jgi:hypothetical protein
MSTECAKYFIWLYNKVKPRDNSYRKLTKKLHSVPFFWSVPRDDNRDMDGRLLRETYSEEHKLPFSGALLSDAGSVLEVLIALAERMDFQLYSPEMGFRSSEWFWSYIKHLGLDSYSDDVMFDSDIMGDIDRSLDVFLNRKYDALGRGGIFPLHKKVSKDQRKVELWYQMMFYLDENYLL